MTHALLKEAPAAAPVQTDLEDYWTVLRRYHAAPVYKRPHLLRNQVWLRWRGETRPAMRNRLRAFLDAEHDRLKTAYGVDDLSDLSPGSRPARDWGCRCPKEPNGGGTGFGGNPHIKVVADACPLHGRAMWRLPT